MTGKEWDWLREPANKATPEAIQRAYEMSLRPASASDTVGELAALIAAKARKPAKIWLAEFESFRRDAPFYPSAWLGEVTDSIAARRKVGDPSAKLLAFAARKFADEASHTDHGFVVMAYRFIATLIFCWPATAQRVVAWLVEHGHLHPRGTRVRDGKMIVNGPNGYILQMRGDVPAEIGPEAAVADDPVAAKVSLIRRIGDAWERWRPCFGLLNRPTGWANTNPLRAFRGDDPAPA